MPHIDIVVSAELEKSIAWRETLRAMHDELAFQGYAILEDLKSRVHCCGVALSGADFDAGQVVATLTMTNPRPKETMAAMAKIVFEHLARATENAAGDRWVQCCVFHELVPKTHYLKRTIRRN